MKDLLCLTTAACLHWLVDAVNTMHDPLDVLVVDDASPLPISSDIRNFCLANGLEFKTFLEPGGLTRSWNWAYQFFLSNNYDTLIISNDDVRFAEGFSSDFIRGMKKFDVICPVSNSPTSNRQRFRPQWIDNYSSLPTSPRKKNRRLIQADIEKHHDKNPFLKVKTFNGFCFGFGKSIEKFVYPDGNLFNAGLINTKNEIHLARRVKNKGGTIAVCKTSYVWHKKGGTFKELKLPKKDWLWPASPLFKENQ